LLLIVAVVVVRALAAPSSSISDLLYQRLHTIRRYRQST
jgi:hypothetical protein